MTRLDILDFISDMKIALQAIEYLSDKAIERYGDDNFSAIDFARKAALSNSNEILSSFNNLFMNEEIED